MSETPFVTVIAPCRNEVDYIENTIKTILNNEYPADKLELLIVDGMSNDGTREIVKKISQKDNRVQLVDNPKKIVPTAMNIGIGTANGEYVVRIDCHTKFERDYILRCIEIHHRTKADNVGGYIATLPGAETSVARAIAAATSSTFGVGNSAFRTGGREKEVDTVPFGTYRKDTFDKIGLYDERLVRNQDIELNSRIRKAGGKIIISPEIKLSYYNRATFRGLWQQSFNNGLWNPYTIWLVGSALSLRHFIPMFFVLGVVILLMGSVIWLPLVAFFIAYILFYFSVAGYFAIKTAKSQKVKPVLVLFSFLILHTAYGLGSLWAILTIPFKFPNRKKKAPGKPLANRKK